MAVADLVGVGAFAALETVVALAADDHVVTIGAGDDVVAVAAVELRVRHRHAGEVQRVVAAVAKHTVAAAGDPDDFLDAARRLGEVAADANAGRLMGRNNPVGAGSPGVGEGIEAVAVADLVGVGAFAALETVIALAANDPVITVIAVDHIGRVVADDIERCIAEQRHRCNGAAKGEGVAGVFRLALDLEVVLGDGQRLAGDGSEQVDPVARAGARIVVRKLQRGKGANQRVARVKNVNRQRHVDHGPANVEELDIGVSGIDCTACRIGYRHGSVGCDGNGVIRKCAIDHIGVRACAAVEDVAADTGGEGVVAVIAVEINADL